MFEEAGTTRDAVDAVVTWPQGPVRFVDTAGMRRAVRVQGVEYFSFVRATEAIERADVALLVIDASRGSRWRTRRSRTASRTPAAGSSLVANKWDLVDEKDKLYRRPPGRR